MSLSRPGKTNSRRLFLKRVGLAGGMLAVSGSLLELIAGPDGQEQLIVGQLFQKNQKRIPLDGHNAPSDWRSVLNFGGEASSTAALREGSLVFRAHDWNAGTEQDDIEVRCGVNGFDAGYVEQRFESPELPILSTRLQTPDVQITLTTFASNGAGEGRVDNLRMELLPKGSAAVKVQPSVSIIAPVVFSKGGNGNAALTIGSDGNNYFLGTNAPFTIRSADGKTSLLFESTELNPGKAAVFLLRFPRAKQGVDKLALAPEALSAILDHTRTFWRGLVPHRESLRTIHPDYASVATSSSILIEQSSSVAPKKRIYYRGAGLANQLRITDAVSILEAVAQYGRKEDALDGVRSIWDTQDEYGIFPDHAGRPGIRETGAALYLLGRHCDLNQNWDLFNQLWPDAVKAVFRLRSLRDKETNFTESLNGKFGILPRAPIGDDDVPRADLTGTLWVLAGLRQIMLVANKFFSGKRTDVRDFQRELYFSLQAYGDSERKAHPGGFTYLPMVASDDPLLKNPEVKKQFVPQFGTYAMTQAIFPGLIHRAEHDFVAGHLKLMQAILKENLPVQTASFGPESVETYHAAALAQMFIWFGLPDQAARTFRSLLNCASPLSGWWDIQSLKAAAQPLLRGAMPSALTAAESLLYLRNAMILEDDTRLRLLDGLVEDDLAAGKPLGFSNVPTRWGPVGFTLEPLDAVTWVGKFTRGEFNGRYIPELKFIELPRRLASKIQFDKLTGGSSYVNGGRVFVQPDSLSWQVTWKDFSRK